MQAWTHMGVPSTRGLIHGITSAGAWTLRRWRGLLDRVRDVYRAAAALICLGRWIHRIPT
jgi:hypothetical protein